MVQPQSVNYILRRDLFKKINQITLSPQDINFSIFEKLRSLEILVNTLTSLSNAQDYFITNPSFVNKNINTIYNFSTFKVDVSVAKDLYSGIMKIYKNIGEIPKQYIKCNTFQTHQDGQGFDINDFFNVLPLLEMKPGLRLNYKIYSSSMGIGKTIFVENIKSKEIVLNQQLSYLPYIVLPKKPLAFFQLALLENILSQVYLYDHGIYARNLLVFDKDDIENIIVQRSVSCKNIFSESDINKIKSINLDPLVRINDDIIEVRITSFNEWNGFQYIYYTFYYSSMKLKVSEKTLVAYHCGHFF